MQSLSARRAWIEITAETPKPSTCAGVALRKESVDRNLLASPFIIIFGVVALRKESVDRNLELVFSIRSKSCRSPQGERG